MSRIIAIDFGTKRIGVAISDPLKMIANGIGHFDEPGFFNWLKNVSTTEIFEVLVIGKPMRMHNVDADVEVEIQVFISKLMKLYPQLKIDRMDERFTSKIAAQSIFSAGAKKKKRREKGLIDKVSATIILQDYLQNYTAKRG